MKDLKDDDFSEVQDYFKVKSVDATRRAFRVRSQMLGEIPANFQNKYEKRRVGSNVHTVVRIQFLAKLIVWSARRG